MANPEELLRLAEKVEGAKGHDDDLVGAVLCAIEGKAFGSTRRGTGDDGSDDLCVYAEGEECALWCQYAHDAPDRSLDAVIALMREKLPGWRIRLMEHPQTGPGWLGAVASLQRSRCAQAPTAPLALLSAFLRALATQEKNHGG